MIAARPRKAASDALGELGVRHRPTVAAGVARRPMRHRPGIELDRRPRARQAAGGPDDPSASVSAATAARCGSSAAGTGSSHRSIRSSSSSPASRRRSWIARWSSRASPSARSSAVSSVSMTTTSPSSCATGGPRPRRGEDLDLVGARVTPGQRHRAIRMDLDATVARRGHDRRDRRAELAARSIGRSGFTRRSTRSDSSPMSSIALTLTSSATSSRSGSSSRRSALGSASQSRRAAGGP